MPKLPPVKDRELLKALSALGFFDHRQQGTSHRILKHLDGRRVVVPMHPGRDIPVGTLHAILRDAKISRDEFLRLL